MAGETTTNEMLITKLIEMEDEELIEVLRAVFNSRTPYPEEQRYFKNHYFLGIATSNLLPPDKSPKASEEAWSQWELNGVAYIDPKEFPSGACGPGFSQFGVCNYCHTRIASNAKSAICPVCGTKCSLS